MTFHQVESFSNKRRIKLIVGWRGKRIKFGEVRFGADESFSYIPSFLNDSEQLSAYKIDLMEENDKVVWSKKIVKNIGFHVTLHPPNSGNSQGILQITPSGRREKIISTPLQWFPVRRYFLLLVDISPPLDSCKTVNQANSGLLLIPDEHSSSIMCVVTVTPKNIIIPAKGSIGRFLGYTPTYWVSCDFVLRQERFQTALFLRKYSDSTPGVESG